MTAETTTPSEPQLDLSAVDRIVADLGTGPDAVIPILQAIQEEYRYLPREALQRVCELTEITPAAITGIATFYDQFRHRPMGRHLIRVCHGTACHVKGSERLHETLLHQLDIHDGEDTDPDGEFTVEKVACLGCCTLAPVLRIDETTYGYMTPERLSQALLDFEASRRNGGGRASAPPSQRPQGECEIRVGLGSCCVAKGSGRLYELLLDTVQEIQAPAMVKRVGCVGMCHQTPLIEIRIPGREPALYAQVEPDEAREIVLKHFRPPGLLRRVRMHIDRALDQLLVDENWAPMARYALEPRDPAVSAFLDRQVHIATEHFGEIDPLDIDEYVYRGGFAALRSCLSGRSAEQVIHEISESGLRGRGGAGFPTGVKWQRVRDAAGDRKYVICNGDEGDPGAFMDRMILESFPYRVIEGLTIAAYAVGASEGYFFIRAEYPLAVERIEHAIRQCEERGYLGDNICGSGLSVKLSIKKGAGAFICGEETAMLEAIEGRRGTPRLRPPYPSESGLWGCPTLINNVETLATVPWILRHGAQRYSALGTETSKGTKVFALAGKVQRGGLIEVPMGITIREIVEEIGGGVAEGRQFKAVQIGGPSGGCVPAALADTRIDYESLSEVGAIMGSGGLVVLDDTDCMVDIARYFLQFTQTESCGQCTFCRIGTRRMLDILERICAGKGTPRDLEDLEQLAQTVRVGSLCGLGQTAPNPVLSTLRYFHDEYVAHLEKRCPAGKCKALITYSVTPRCTGCTLCSQHCPYDAIPMTPYVQHEIDSDLCERCDICRTVCPEGAIEVK